MKYVLLKLEDGQAEKFLAKHSGKALGVWEVAAKCGCGQEWQKARDSWVHDAHLGRIVCTYCGGAVNTVTTLAERLQMAFLGKNLISRYRGRRNK